MKSLTLQSPAKLNLFLKVINKRTDGYHTLHTLFERIDLCDEISLTNNETGKIKIFCDHPQVPKNKRNLVHQVADRLRKAYDLKVGVDIRIVKNIPVAAGLGGGSSNAATVLLGLNNLWKLGLSKEILIDFAQEIGSDVPFFLHDCSWGVGVDRGDTVEPVPLETKIWHILVVPRIKMYSREVFTKLNLELTKGDDNVNILIHSLKSDNILRVEELVRNDLTTSILDIRPSLMKVSKRLQSLNIKAVNFSGSGPSVFGITHSKKETLYFKNILSKYYKQVYAVRTL